MRTVLRDVAKPVGVILLFLRVFRRIPGIGLAWLEDRNRRRGRDYALCAAAIFARIDNEHLKETTAKQR